MKKWLVLLVVMFSGIMLSGCTFSEHGAIYDDEERWVLVGDTYSFLGKYYHDQEITFKRFSGIFTLDRMDADEDVTITIEQSISSGRFTCIIVTEDDEIIILNEGVNLIPASDGKMRLRIIGDDAKGSLSFKFS